VSHKIRKTIVGSLPRLDNSLEASIERAVDLQLRYGLDIVTEGEQRGDMINYFDQIPGLMGRDGKVGVIGRIRQPHHVEDLHKLKDFKLVREHLKQKRIENVEVKIGVTGPTTLGLTCASTQLKDYKSVADLELYEDLGSALKPLIDELLRLDAYVQIDEPGISAKFQDPHQSTRIINEVVRDLKQYRRGSGRLSVHVCGNLTRTPGLFGLLNELDVDVLSLAFGGKAEGQNFELLSDNVLNRSGKRIGFGCLSVTSSTIDAVEPVPNVVKLLNDGISKIGVERLAYVHPNCGLRNTSLNVAQEILERMKASVEEITRAK
jgi:5-methyltetrahydropteroyltriglutamate--homocysteine methyltransferase